MSNDDTRRHLAQANARLLDAEVAIEAAIRRIPSGPIRNEVTEANIRIKIALEKLREADRLALANIQQGEK
jgi:hypothetical protein